MRDPKNRDVMSQLYRIMEKYETPPVSCDHEGSIEYFETVMFDVKKVFDANVGNEFAEKLCLALYDAIGERFKKSTKIVEG